MNKLPITQCQSWIDCIKQLEQSGISFPAHKDPADLKLALLPVLTIAWYLAINFTELMKKDALRIWLIGAELIDGRDGGAWYQALNHLLEINKIEITLIGPNVPADVGAANIFKGRAEDLLTQMDVLPPDVAVIFHPGFEEEDSLLSSGLVSRLLDEGVTVLGSSYSEEEYARDRLVCEAYGHRLATDADNPFSLDPGETGLHWADRMWHFDPEVIPERHAYENPDQELVDAVKCLSRMVAHSRLMGNWAQPAPPGTSFQIPDTRGGQRIMVHIMDSYYLDPASRRLYGVEDGKLKPFEISVDPSDVENIPDSPDPMKLALWAARIKERYLLTSKKPVH